MTITEAHLGAATAELDEEIAVREKEIEEYLAGAGTAGRQRLVFVRPREYATPAQLEEIATVLRQVVMRARDAEDEEGSEVTHLLGTLERQLTSANLGLARAAHIELLSVVSADLATCGYIDTGRAGVLNGLKALVEVSGTWTYEDGEWRSRRRARAEVAK